MQQGYPAIDLIAVAVTAISLPMAGKGRGEGELLLTVIGYG